MQKVESVRPCVRRWGKTKEKNLIAKNYIVGALDCDAWLATKVKGSQTGTILAGQERGYTRHGGCGARSSEGVTA